MPSRVHWPRRRAFTLIELLVVVAVIALLVGLLLPAVQSAREAAWRVQCLNNLKQLGIALHGYHDAAQTFPAGIMLGIDSMTPGWGWGFHLLPYLEQRPAYDSANLQDYLFMGSNETVATIRLQAFMCPSGGDASPFDSGYLGIHIAARKDPAPAQYVACSGRLKVGVVNPGGLLGLGGQGDGAFYSNSRISIAGVADGLSQTLFVGERSRNVADATWAGAPASVSPLCTKSTWAIKACESSMFMLLGRTGPGTSPDLLPYEGATTSYTPNAPDSGPDGFWSLHPGGCHFLMGDGSARSIRSTISGSVFSALGSVAGGEIVGASDY